MIPKICHFVYTNGSPISWLQVLSVKSFHRYNPDWKIILHMIKQRPDELAKNTDVPDYTGPDYTALLYQLDYLQIIPFDLDEWGIRKDIHGLQASDIIRCRMMNLTGGVYSDFDMLWLRPMSYFFDVYTGNFETSVCIHPNGHYNMSNIVSEPYGEFMRQFCTAQNNVGEINDYQVFNAVLFRKLWPTRDILTRRFTRVLMIDYETFYPYSIYSLDELYKKTQLTNTAPPRVVGVHWFCGHHLSKEYINNELYGNDCSMSAILMREEWI